MVWYSSHIFYHTGREYCQCTSCIRLHSGYYSAISPRTAGVLRMENESLKSTGAEQAVVEQRNDDVRTFSDALYGYASEVHNQSTYCAQHDDTAAIHERGTSLQIYRLFKSDETVSEHLHLSAKLMEPWNKSQRWACEGRAWCKTEGEINTRLKKHTKQTPVLTKGIDWKGRPMLIHAYKFDADPQMKVEVVVPDKESNEPERALTTITRALECHEALVPECISTPRPPYERHESKFERISDYLRDKLPSEMYNLTCFSYA